ncbi:Uncharacterised protein [uncultured archaeon]|nr:Uncharacterised protein [uncultured archaeon]
MEGCCKGHKMWWGIKALVLGLLVLGNTYWQVMGWDMFIGWILVLGGLLKLVIPSHY